MVRVKGEQVISTHSDHEVVCNGLEHFRIDLVHGERSYDSPCKGTADGKHPAQDEDTMMRRLYDACQEQAP